MPTFQFTGLTAMFHRVIGLSSVLLVCVAGCSLHGHHSAGCCQQGHPHGHKHGHPGSLKATCGTDVACTCTAPLYPGDQNCHGNCLKHQHQRPIHRMATAFRRSSSQWMSGPHANGCACGSCGSESYFSQPTMWEQNACGQPLSGGLQSCGCDSCAISMTGGVYETPGQGSTDCGCGQQISTNGAMYIPEGSGPSGYTAEYPMMSIPADNHSQTGPRSFGPTSPLEAAPSPPGALNENGAKPLPTPPTGQDATPMPQDLTPVDPPMEFPKNAPGEFDPLQEEAAPAAGKVVDPVSYEVPRLPPIPVRAHSSVQRGGP